MSLAPSLHAANDAGWSGAGWGPVVPVVTEETLGDGSALQELLEELRRRHTHLDEGLITRAFEAAQRAHASQRRKSGEPYFIHPVRVAHSIAQLGLDSSSVAAGLLHDAVEDSEITVFELTEQFGREVANIVDGVTKLGKVPFLTRATQQAESFRKMLLAMSRDIRVLLVKLLDRLDNMRTLEHMTGDQQERISRETMQIYAPLANRLGLEGVRRELQDLSFRYLEPVVFEAVRADIEAVLARHPGQPDKAMAGLREAFASTTGYVERTSAVATPDDERVVWPVVSGPVDVRVSLRTPYRVHRRREATGRTLELSDVLTFQVITPDRASCYSALGVLHAHFQPVPGRFRDYVALPRPNHYRGLHTSLVAREGGRLELQIRSRAMDDVAQRGIAAAWKDGAHPGADPDRLAWLRGLMDWQEDVSDPNEFIAAVKADLFADEIYVFTPGGDVHMFPKGATPIDFAFAIHSDVGMHCSGARVNGQAVPLRYHLRQGDTVEIITNPNHGPRPEWMSMCVTSRAKARIRQHLRQEDRQHLREVGRSLVEQVLKGRGLVLADYEQRGWVAELAEDLGLPRDARDIEGVYAAIGAGQFEAESLAQRLATRDGKAEHEDHERGNLITRMFRLGRRGREGRGGTLHGATPSAPMEVTRDRVTAPGGGRPVIELAPCCSPVPGDSLVGVFEAGRGITAHVEGCPAALEHLSERKVYLSWEEGLALERPVTVEVRTANMVGLLAEMSRAFSANDVNIKQANCRSLPDGDRAINTFQASVSTLAQLEALIHSLKHITGVLGVERVFTQGSGSYPRPV